MAEGFFYSIKGSYAVDAIVQLLGSSLCNLGDQIVLATNSTEHIQLGYFVDLQDDISSLPGNH